MLSSVRNRMIFELLVSPWSVFPAVGGLSILMLSWALNVWGTVSFMGFLSVLFGVGAAVTNLFLNLDSIAEKAVKALRDQKIRERESQLNTLNDKLWLTENQKERHQLFDLRKLYKTFLDDLEKDRMDVSPEILSRVEQIFNMSVASIEEAFNIWSEIKTIDPNSKLISKLKQRREKLLSEVQKSVELLSNTMVEVRASSLDSNSDLSRLRDDLFIQIESARRTKERMAVLDGESERDFSEYET